MSEDRQSKEGNLIPAERTGKSPILQVVDTIQNKYNVTWDPIALSDHQMKEWSQIPNNEQTSLHDIAANRTWLVGDYYSRMYELGLGLVELTHSNITERDLQEMEAQQSLKGKKIVSVGGTWGEWYSTFGAECISIDPAFDSINVPQAESQLITRYANPINPETVADKFSDISPDLIICSGLFEAHSGVEEVSGYQKLEQGLAELMKKNPSSRLIVKGEPNIVNKYFSDEKYSRVLILPVDPHAGTIQMLSLNSK